VKAPGATGLQREAGSRRSLGLMIGSGWGWRFWPLRVTRPAFRSSRPCARLGRLTQRDAANALTEESPPGIGRRKKAQAADCDRLSVDSPVGHDGTGFPAGHRDGAALRLVEERRHDHDRGVRAT
jgi:hypothetical protein